jgi:hypothetical protein
MMARNYSVSNNAAGTANGTNVDLLALQLPTSPTVRSKLYDFTLSSVATPADQSALYTIMRTTTAGAATGGTAFTPVALDNGDPVSLSTAMSGLTIATAAVTAASWLIQVSVNLRATFRWVAVPGKELAAQNANFGGFMFRTLSSTASFASNVQAYYEE